MSRWHLVLTIAALPWVGACGSMNPAVRQATADRRPEPNPRPAPAPVSEERLEEPVSPHPDYLALRPLHTYYRLVRVGPTAHHFQGWYAHYELCDVTYELDSETGELRRTGYGYGRYSEAEAEDVPAEQRARAEAIRHDIETETPEARSIVLRYLGEYREVTVEEILARPGTHDAGYAMTMTLAVDGDLSHVRGPTRPAVGGGAALHLTGGGTDPTRARAPVWIDAAPDRPGAPRLWAMLGERSDPRARDALYEAVLAATRRQAVGDPPLALGELAVQRDPAVLPSGIDDGLRLVCDETRWREHETLQARVSSMLALGGEADGHVTVGAGGSASCWARYELVEPLPEGTVGERELSLALRWSIRLGALLREGTTHLRARALVESGQIAIVELIGSDAGPDAQALHTTLSGDRVEVHVGLAREY